MIVYNPECGMSIADFGILIPIRYDKQEMVFQGLKKGSLADVGEERWRLKPSCSGIGREDLLRVHSQGYVDRLFSPAVEEEAIRTFELVNKDGTYNRWAPERAVRPLSELLTRALMVTEGTYECGKKALETGFAYFLGGGMHHATPDYGAGFCMVNDIVIAVRKLQAEKLIRTAWIIDVDAHKGDGTAIITRGDDSIRTLSIHMGAGWPLDAPEYDENGTYNLSYTPSDIDIDMMPGEDGLYLSRLETGLEELALLSRPDFALVVDGSDPYEKDELPSTASLSLSMEELYRRDMLVYDFLQSRGISSAWIMAGGYGQSSWEVYVNFLGKLLPSRLAGKGPG
jgi:acetoin utilization deacetylase AcuC-like enzyme